VSLALAMSSTVFLLADVVLGNGLAIVTCALTMAGFGLLWFAVPLRRRPTAAAREGQRSAR
jgi:hypothetical protein